MPEPIDEGLEQVKPGDPRHGLIWINRWISIEKVVDGLSRLKTVEEGLHRHARPMKARRPAHPGPATREHTVAVLELARRRLVPEGRAA